MTTTRVVGELLAKVRGRRPLVHNITNFVVMNTTANALLSLGASPIMAHSPEELEDLVRAADSIVINIGTLDDKWIYSSLRAVSLAKEYRKPVVLDPVGAGATRLRTWASKAILGLGAVSIVRGNLGEISALAGVTGRIRGVDSIAEDYLEAGKLALDLARKHSVAVAVSGRVDVASNGSIVYTINPVINENHPLPRVVGRVTGLGCILSSIIGAFAAVAGPLEAAIAGLSVFKSALIKAAEEAPYPGSFHVKIYDWLYKLNPEDVESLVRVEKLEKL